MPVPQEIVDIIEKATVAKEAARVKDMELQAKEGAVVAATTERDAAYDVTLAAHKAATDAAAEALAKVKEYLGI